MSAEGKRQQRKLGKSSRFKPQTSQANSLMLREQSTRRITRETDVQRLTALTAWPRRQDAQDAGAPRGEPAGKFPPPSVLIHLLKKPFEKFYWIFFLIG